MGFPIEGESELEICESKTIRWQRVEYAVEKAQERIIRSGLPKVLADRLALGI